MIKRSTVRNNGVRVTFELPADAAQESVAVVGDFNDWDQRKHPMKLDKKKEHWRKAVTLEPGKEYRFRYVIDGGQWQNDGDADRFEANPFGTENGVLAL